MHVAEKTGAASELGGSNFRGGHSARPDDIFIAVMGVTGCGKSSFISRCSGEDVEIGHNLDACTARVSEFKYDISPGRRVYLVDTPGFDDTNRSDMDVLREIATWLGDSYRNNIKLHGIIYMHRISDRRMQGSAVANLDMFKKLCGEDALRKVVLVTSMWDIVPSEEACRRESELREKDDFWGSMIKMGSRVFRHDNTEESARGIVGLLAQHNSRITTSLQKELVEERRTLNDTSAGREVQSEVLKEKEKWEKKQKQMEEHMREAIRTHNREAEEVLRKERDKYKALIQRIEDDSVDFLATIEELVEERNKRVARMEKKLEKQQAGYDRKLEKQQASYNKRLMDLEMRQRQLAEQRDREKKEAEKHKLELVKYQKQQEKLQTQLQQQLRLGTQQNQTGSVAVTPPAEVPTVDVLSPFSLSMVSSKRVICAGRIQGNRRAMISEGQWPKMRDPKILTHATLSPTSGDWVARYQDGTWKQSSTLGNSYPELAAVIKYRGLGNLEFCVLGPGNHYFARWRTGHWKSWTATDVLAVLKKGSDETRQHRVFAMSFGYGGSWLVSYGKSPKGTLYYDLDLKGHHSNLRDFLRANHPSILAIALDPTSSTDYIMVWRRDDPNSSIHLRHSCSVETVSAEVTEWWAKL